MGTSGACGGSLGWKPVKDQTQEWLSTGAAGTGAGPAPARAAAVGGRALGGAYGARTVTPRRSASWDST
jgi:hypothetical protein